MKNRHWACIWTAMLLICVIAGLATRFSFTDVTADAAQMENIPYSFSKNYQAKNFQGIEPDDMKAQSQLIVTASFHGDRAYKNGCCLCGVTITGVLKGDQSLLGKNLMFYEMVSVEKSKKNRWVMSSDYEALVKKFKLEDKEEFSILNGDGAFSLQPPLQVGQEYLFFLTEKVYPTVMERGDAPPEYNQIESPYAVLSLNQPMDAASYKLAGALLSLQEASRYDVLLTTKESAQTYFQNKKLLLDSVLN